MHILWQTGCVYKYLIAIVETMIRIGLIFLCSQVLFADVDQFNSDGYPQMNSPQPPPTQQPQTGYPAHHHIQRGLAQDWHDKWHDRGVDLSASYYVEFAGNPVGGAAHGFGNAGSLNAAIGLDFEKLIHIPGLSLFSSAVFRSGVNLSAQRIDNQFPVTQLYGGETVRLNELYLEQSLFNNRFHLKAGRLTGGNDFLASPFYCQFINNAFCGNPISIFFNSPFLAFPFSAWGAYMDIYPTPNLIMKVAVYNGNRSTLQNKYHGCNFTFQSTAGVIWITEWVYLLNQGQKDTGYAGNYKIGGYYQTGKVEKYDGTKQTGDYGLYGLFDQMLYRSYGPGTTQGLSMFASFLFAPPNRNRFPYFFDLAFIYKGLIPSRELDYLTLGVAYGRYSSDLRNAELEAQRMGVPGPHGDKPQSQETILELNYWYRFSDWLAITPDIQYVINPKGYGTTPNALVLAVQLSLDLIGVPKQP